MDMQDFLYYGVMESSGDALAQFNARWKHLVNVHNDIIERFISPVLDKGDDDFKQLVDQVEAQQKYIFDHIEHIEPVALSVYAYNLKKLALVAMKLCQKHKICEIESAHFNVKTKVIELNGQDLYFLGDIEADCESLQVFLCPKCSSTHVVSYSVRHQELQSKGLISSFIAFAPPTEKTVFSFVFMGVFLWFAALNSFSSDGSAINIVVGIICFGWAHNASKYNKNEFPLLFDAWRRSFYCHDCGSSFEKKKL